MAHFQVTVAIHRNVSLKQRQEELRKMYEVVRPKSVEHQHQMMEEDGSIKRDENGNVVGVVPVSIPAEAMQLDDEDLVQTKNPFPEDVRAMLVKYGFGLDKYNWSYYKPVELPYHQLEEKFEEISKWFQERFLPWVVARHPELQDKMTIRMLDIPGDNQAEEIY